MIRNLRLIASAPGVRVIFDTIVQHRKWVIAAICSLMISVLVQGGALGIFYSGVQAVVGEADAIPTYFEALPRVANWLASLSQASLLIIIVIAAIVAQLIQSTSMYLAGVSAGILSAEVEFFIRKTLFKQVLSFSFSQSAKYKVGDLVQHIDQAAAAVQLLVSNIMWTLIHAAFTFVYAVVALYISPWLFVVVLIIGLGFIYIQRVLLPKLARTSLAFTIANVKVIEYVTEIIQASRLIHSFGAFQHIETLLVDKQSELTYLRRKHQYLVQLTNPITLLMTTVALGAVLIAFLFQNEDFSNPDVLASLFVFLFSVNRLSNHLRIMTAAVTGISENYGNIFRLNELLDRTDKEFHPVGGIVDFDFKSALNFDAVTLQYENTKRPALSNLSFNIPVGSVTALVGASGAGKSSIADLLAGLYQPTAGDITVDGVSLQRLDLNIWRNYLSIVSQDSFLFNMSIADNIRFGQFDASDDAVAEAAKKANALSFIEALPDKFDTIIGERGYKLSGGQRQRIALARALLRQSKLLILDEATSALDSASERLIQEAIDTVRTERTILVIAHRLSTVLDADQILLLEEGQLVEQGTHSKLLAQDGLYANFWRLQSETNLDGE